MTSVLSSPARTGSSDHLKKRSASLAVRAGVAAMFRRGASLSCLLGVLAVSTAAQAAPALGAQAGTYGVKLKALGIFPHNSNSSVEAIGGTVDVSSRIAPELDLYYFITDNIAAQLIATLTRPSIDTRNSSLDGGVTQTDVDVGAVTVLPPTLTLQYHFFPQSAFNPYVGAGLSLVWLFAANPSEGDGIVENLGFDDAFNPSAAIQAGIDYNIDSHWFANFEINQIFLSVDATVDTVLGDVRAKDDINPFLVSFGIGYRF